MSWFGNVESLAKDWGSKVNMENIKGITEKVQKSIPKIDNEMIGKLTLTSPELSEERHRIDREERRKEEVRDMLAGLLPWETRDSEREILVEECREAILKLSREKETFYGPYPMPRSGVKLEDDKEKGGSEDEDDLLEGSDGAAEIGTGTDIKPPASSLEKLEKLEPLPALLRDFDLDTHVGLIKKLLQADPNLVAMQSTLSGGGEREKVFWHNYFFHCAYTRYEAGLSIDEIWSDEPLNVQGGVGNAADASDQSKAPAAASSAAAVAGAGASEGKEHEIVFDHSTSSGNRDEKGPSSKSAPSTDKDTGSASNRDADKDGSSDTAEYEMVGGPVENDGTEGNVDDDDDVVDYELDELEAEIARELED